MNVPADAAQSWAVVGGGMLGLTLAHRLSQSGRRVTVFEAAPEIGGLAAAWQVGDVTWDKHYHVTLLSDLKTRGLLSDLGLEQELAWVETKTGFFTDGRYHSMSNSWEFLTFPPLRIVDKLRLGATIWAASHRTDWQSLEQTPVVAWLRKWSGRRTCEKIWQPLLQAKLGPAHERCSAAFIWATIARMYGARQAGLKKEMFGYVRGGYARVLERFAETLRRQGVELRTHTPVAKVTGHDAGAVVETSAGLHECDRVVLTTPSPHVLAACPQLPPDQRERHAGIEYLGVVCASVVLSRPLAGYYVTNITDAGFPFTAVIDMTALVDPRELGGRFLAYLPRYATADDPIWSQSDEQIRDSFLAGLKRMFPDLAEDQILAFRVSRAPHVMGLPTLGYSTRLPSLDTGVPNVLAVNSAHVVKGTLNVNEIITLADHALTRLQVADAPAHSLPCATEA